MILSQLIGTLRLFINEFRQKYDAFWAENDGNNMKLKAPVGF